jgi:Na+-translocating ferredoxin:NAD+ oxidoreductase RnfG subunit
MKKKFWFTRIIESKYIESLLNSTLLLLFLMAAVSYNGKWFGHSIDELASSSPSKKVEMKAPTSIQLRALGVTNVNLQQEVEGLWSYQKNEKKQYIAATRVYSNEIYGFGGPVPMLLHLDASQHITNIVLLENNETPDFLESVKKHNIVEQWKGKSPNEINQFTPDAVSGATLTSNAVNKSIQSTLNALGNTSTTSSWSNFIDFKSIIALLVILSGVILSFKAKGKKQLRTLQLILNTVVLGFWCGKFISLQILMGWVSNGINLATSFVLLTMLMLAVIMPLFFKKKSYYCFWVCPFGSMQELAGKLSRKKHHPNKRWMKILKHSQSTLTLALFFCLWLGVASDWINYEPFSAFLFEHASIIVLVIAGINLVVAIFTPRPWCRFVCPTGQLLNWTHKM